MIGPAYCNGCGKRLEVPAGYGKSKLRCPDCGVFTELPKEIRQQGQASDRPAPPRAAPRSPPPTAKPPVRAKPAPPSPPARAAAPPPPAPAASPPADDDANLPYAFHDEPEADVPDPPRRT